MAYNRQITGNKNYSFAKVPQVTVPRSKFNRAHNVKTTFQAGDLVPIFLDEVLPGDTLNLKMDSIIRTNTFINPIMDNIYVNTFWFFVPCRLLWDNWEKFQGAQDNPTDSINFTIPQVTALAQTEGTLWDYFGLPTRITNLISVNALPFRAYNLIYKEWFRSQDIINSPVINKGNGPDGIGDYPLRKRMKRADYFTRCLPWPQKGGAAQLLPLGTSAPVISTSVAGVKQPIIFENLNGNVQFNAQGVAGTPTIQRAAGNFAATGNIGLYTPSNIVADLSQATAATINDLRQAFQIQRLLERDARSGTRYQESIKAHFGVSSPDERAQRPEILSIGQSMVMVNPVANTTNTTPANIQAELAAYGVASIANHGFTYSSTEHGYVIGLINARADLTYWQGIHKLWDRQRRYDFYIPVLSHLGEQPVRTREIYATGLVGDDVVFGYQERWAEYRYKPSQICGLFRPSATPLNLSDWHLAQNFATAPTLNATFMQENPPMSRVYNSVAAGLPDFWADIHYTYICARPMPLYSVPGLIDHF